jgi:hypothetical protein
MTLSMAEKSALARETTKVEGAAEADVDTMVVVGATVEFTGAATEVPTLSCSPTRGEAEKATDTEIVEVERVRLAVGAGKYATPWDVRFPDVKGKLLVKVGDVAVRALAYRYRRSDVLSTIQMSFDTSVGSIAMPVGDLFAVLSVQKFCMTPARLYRNTRSVLASLTTQIDVPSVARSFGARFCTFRTNELVASTVPDRKEAPFA